VVRRLVAGLIVVGLAVGVWALWPREDSDTTPTTLPVAIETTTTTTLATSTTVVNTTTTEDDGSHVVTTVEEAETILRELWFGWFEGIYNQDEERIKEVVGTQQMLDNARAAFEAMSFESQPVASGVNVSETEILRNDVACLVTLSTLDVTDFSGTDGVETSVFVVRRAEDRWVLATVWINREDLWQQDCASELEPLS